MPNGLIKGLPLAEGLSDARTDMGIMVESLSKLRYIREIGLVNSEYIIHKKVLELTFYL